MLKLLFADTLFFNESLYPKIVCIIVAYKIFYVVKFSMLRSGSGVSTTSELSRPIQF